MNTPTPEHLEQLEQQTPAMIFVQQVNENEPGTFPTDDEMQIDHVEGDVDTFTNDENI